MKKNEPAIPPIISDPSGDDILDYAYHLYQRDHCLPDHDLDNWIEALAHARSIILAS
jgi:hypothetical protein